MKLGDCHEDVFSVTAMPMREVRRFRLPALDEEEQRSAVGIVADSPSRLAARWLSRHGSPEVISSAAASNSAAATMGTPP